MFCSEELEAVSVLWVNNNADEVASLHMAQGSSLNINGPRVKTDLRNLTAAGN